MKIAKFGGTSVGTVQHIDQCLRILMNDPSFRVAVISATANTSNELTLALQKCYLGKWEAALDFLNRICDRHLLLAENCGGSQVVLGEVKDIFEEGVRVLDKLRHDRENYYQYADHVLAIGERVSSLIFSERAKVLQLNAELVDVTQLLITDSLYGRANPIIHLSKHNVETYLKPKINDALIVTQGFIARDKRGHYTTLGREGSDYSVSLLGAMLEVEEIALFKRDVKGIYQFDPRVLSDVKVIGKLSYGDAINMTYLGAKVLHHKTVFPAMQQGIPIRVDSSEFPFQEGTLISEEGGSGLIGLSRRTDQYLLYLKNTDFLDTHVFVEKINGIFSKYRFNIDLLTICKNSAYIVIDDSVGGTIRGAAQMTVFENTGFKKELSEFADYQLIDKLELVSVIGDHNSGTLNLMIEAVGQLDVKYFFASPERNSFSVLVDQSDVLSCLHAMKNFLNRE